MNILNIILLNNLTVSEKNTMYGAIFFTFVCFLVLILGYNYSMTESNKKERLEKEEKERLEKERLEKEEKERIESLTKYYSETNIPLFFNIDSVGSFIEFTNASKNKITAFEIEVLKINAFSEIETTNIYNYRTGLLEFGETYDIWNEYCFDRLPKLKRKKIEGIINREYKIKNLKYKINNINYNYESGFINLKSEITNNYKIIIKRIMFDDGTIWEK